MRMAALIVLGLGIMITVRFLSGKYIMDATAARITGSNTPADSDLPILTYKEKCD